MGNRWIGILSLAGATALAGCSPADSLPEPPKNYLLVDTTELGRAFVEEDPMRWGLYGEITGPKRIEGVVEESQKLKNGSWRIGLDTEPLDLKLNVNEVPSGLEETLAPGERVAAFCEGVGMGPLKGNLLVSGCQLDREFMAARE